MQCSFCKMDIPSDATKCGYCAEWFVPKTPTPKRDRWDKVDFVAKALSAVAVPVLLLVGGYLTNRALSEMNNRAKAAETDARLIEVAVGVLQSQPQPTQRGDVALRAWAIRLINARLDDVKLDEKVQTYLQNRPLPVITSPFPMQENPAGPFGPTNYRDNTPQATLSPYQLVANKPANTVPKPTIRWTGKITRHGKARNCRVTYVDLGYHPPLIKPIIKYVEDDGAEQTIYIDYETQGGKMVHVEGEKYQDAVDGTVTIRQVIQAPSGDATFEVIFDTKDGYNASHGTYEFRGSVKLPR